MARYRNVNSGALVEVRDDKVMGGEWESVTEKPAPKRAAAKSDSK